MSDTPTAVRILPMDRHGEFPMCDSPKSLQEKFFLHEFPRRPKGQYRYRRCGLRAEPGTVVLFQSDGMIVASATVTGTEMFEQPYNDGYMGALYFDVSTIRMFEPMSWEAVSNIWPNVQSFNQTKWNLDPNGYAAFERELKGVKKP